MTDVNLRQLLKLDHLVRASDGAGGFTEIWVELGALWAEILPGAGRDAKGEEVILSSIPYRVIVRGAPQGSDRRPKPGQRFRDGGRTFAILAVTERADLYLTCFCREEAPT